MHMEPEAFVLMQNIASANTSCSMPRIPPEAAYRERTFIQSLCCSDYEEFVGRRKGVLGIVRNILGRLRLAPEAPVCCQYVLVQSAIALSQLHIH